MNVGKKLNEIRTNKQLSVYRLSRLSEVSENYIHEIEKGTKQPSVYILERILTALGVTLAEFFNDHRDVIYPTEFEKKFIHAIRVLPKEKANAIFKITELMQ